MKEQPIQKPTDDAEYKKLSEAFQKLQLELIETVSRNQEVEQELSRPKNSPAQDAFEQYLSPAGKYEASHDHELREELRYGREREVFLTKAIEQGRMKVDGLLGRLSLKICEERRAEYVELVRGIVSAAFALAEANRKECDFIANLEAQDIRTGSISRALITRIGSPDDPNSLLSHWLRETEQNYPELCPLKKSA